jgi:hypothetical protein
VFAVSCERCLPRHHVTLTTLTEPVAVLHCITLHRSPEPGARRTNIYGSPPTGAAPQPSQHLRAAAHTAGRRAPQPGRDSAGSIRVDVSDHYQEEFPVLGSGARNAHKASRGYADALAGPADLHNKAASAAAMAAVAGLKPTVMTAPPRSSASKPLRKSNPEGGFYAGPQLPSVEETKAAVMAALGSGPGSNSLTHSGSGVDSPRLQDAVQQHAQDSRQGGSSAAEWAEGPAQLRKASSSSSMGGEAPSAPAPRRNVVAATGLFSNVIGQLRRQSTARDSPDAQEGGEEGGYLTPASRSCVRVQQQQQHPHVTAECWCWHAASVSFDRSRRLLSYCPGPVCFKCQRNCCCCWGPPVACMLLLAAVGSAEGEDAPSSRSSYLSAASAKSRRGAPEGNAADIVLAVINSTRQRASKLSDRSRQVRNQLAGPLPTGDRMAGPLVRSPCTVPGRLHICHATTG